jgi:hypothetical protein
MSCLWRLQWHLEEKWNSYLRNHVWKPLHTTRRQQVGISLASCVAAGNQKPLLLWRRVNRWSLPRKEDAEK